MKFTGVIFLSNSLLTAAFAPGEFEHKCVNYSWLLCVHEMWYGGGLALAACAAPLERIRIIHMTNGEHEAINQWSTKQGYVHASFVRSLWF